MDALAAAGIHPLTDQASFDQGRLRLTFRYSVRGQLRELAAEFPDAYPYFAPQVFLHGERLIRHHNPEGLLCLLANDGENWHPGQDTLASLLRDQMPLIESSTDEAADPADAAAAEDEIGEPLSNYLVYQPHSSIIVSDATPPAEVGCGRLEARVRPQEDAESPLNGFLLKVVSLAGSRLVALDLDAPQFTQRVSGFWARLPQRPALDAAKQKLAHDWVQDELTKRCPAFETALNAARAGSVFLCGLVYPDEKTWRKSSDDWLLFAVVVKRARRGAKPPIFSRHFIRSDWGGEDAVLVRAPFLKPLRSKSALLIGLGALGSTVALQLAKSGIGQLVLVDSDRLQVGNSVRWALGWNGTGYPKSFVVAQHIAREYPSTRTVSENFHIGAPLRTDGGIFQSHEKLTALVEQANLVLDASANYRVSHYLTDLARQLRKPYLWLTTTPGAHGGVVGRIRPGQTPGCWHCFQRSLATNAIKMPADSGIKLVQPGGCMQATFVGAGIDSDVVSQLASRLAVATLCAGDQNGYHEFPWDVAVGDLYENGNPLPGVWSTYTLDVHPDCPAH